MNDEIINWLEWELLADPVEFKVTDPGDIDGTIETAIVSRNDDLRISVLIHGHDRLINWANTNTKQRLGELFPKPRELKGVNQGGERFVINGLFVFNRSLGSDERLSIDAFCNEFQSFFIDEKSYHLIEWLVNFKIGRYLLPRSTTRMWLKEFSRDRNDEPEVNIDLNKPKYPQSVTRDHIKIALQCFEIPTYVLVGAPPKGISEKYYHPGFIQYSKSYGYVPLPEERKKVLSAISFAFGRQLVPIGATSFNTDWHLCGQSSRSANYLGNLSDMEQPSMPPTIISIDGIIVNESSVEKVVEAFLSCSQTMDIEFPLWFVWLASVSPLDARTAHLGAALEALRREYVKKTSKLKTKHLEEHVWAPIKSELEKPINNSIIRVDDEIAAEMRVLLKKIQQLNDKSSRSLYTEFFDVLDLPTGEVELEALKERNRPVHGQKYLANQYQIALASSNALYALFNRVVLKITGGANTYIDYSTYGYPSRLLEEPLGGPEGDGKPVS